MLKFLKYIVCIVLIVSCNEPTKKDAEQPGEVAYPNEPHRLKLHFSPKGKWMNDPNGLFQANQRYHLFYQYYPDSTVWGPMHWGHATSTDLLHWDHQPIALYPDSLGYIFSGSAVIDSSNTSGFGNAGKSPVVAIFTHHDPKGEKKGTSTYQYQSIAYSLDEGQTWTKYAGNPVLKNPGIKDFRDPKVSWHKPSKKWIMSLATLDRITFYSSPNLKDWTKESEFGEKSGAHGGVWECPDLFTLYNEKDEEVWVLLVSINPGGPNGGSATQYFTGQFDGKTFTPYDTITRWIDYGPDNYAGVTWSNTGSQKIFIGWMSNWDYGQKVPTANWRSAMTLPRELSLERVGQQYFVRSWFTSSLYSEMNEQIRLENVDAKNYDVTAKTGKLTGPAIFTVISGKIESFSVTLSNAAGEQLVVGYDKAANNYFIDRTKSGKVDFEQRFASRSTAPRVRRDSAINLTLVIDNASVEVFADEGLPMMTAIFFPTSNYTDIKLQSADGFIANSLLFSHIKPTIK